MIEVHVWRCDLDVDAATLDSLSATLSADELHRASRYHAPLRRRRAIAASGMLRSVLARYAGIDPPSLAYGRGPRGKPHLVSGDRRAGVRFSVARSGSLEVVAVARGREVGIDVEEIVPARVRGPIAERLFAAREVADLDVSECEGRVGRFFELWTRKEAHAKALGAGLSLPLERLGAPPAGWLLRDVCVADGFACAICVQARRARVRVFEHRLAIPHPAAMAL